MLAPHIRPRDQTCLRRGAPLRSRPEGRPWTAVRSECECVAPGRTRRQPPKCARLGCHRWRRGVTARYSRTARPARRLHRAPPRTRGNFRRATIRKGNQLHTSIKNDVKTAQTARYRGISQIWLCLRVRNLATEGRFLPPVSDGLFWCLVFDVLWNSVRLIGFVARRVARRRRGRHRL